MSEFLVVVRKTIVDQAFVAAIPEKPAEMDNTVDPPVEISPAVPAVPEVPLITHDEVGKVYMEKAPETIAFILDLQEKGDPAMANYDVYALDFNPQLRPTVKTVRIKSRAAAPAKELVTIETQDGIELGSGEF